MTARNLLGESISANESYLHLFDLASGRPRCSRHGAGRRSLEMVGFAPDDASFFTVTDKGWNLACSSGSTWPHDRTSAHGGHSLDIVDLNSPDGRQVACTNEAGVSVAHLNVETVSSCSRKSGRRGWECQMAWQHRTRFFAELRAHRWMPGRLTWPRVLTRWTESETGGLDRRSSPSRSGADLVV